jgi:opacity protein-like surface antigen
MARKSFGISLLSIVMILAGTALAQKSNEVAGVVGRTFISDQSVNGSIGKIRFGDGLAYEGNFSHRFLNLGIVGVSVEVPFVYNPSTQVAFGGGNQVPKEFRAYFITPAARVTLFPTTAFNPWVSVGGGFASFSPSSTLHFGGPNPNSKSTTSGVFEVGGGLDVRIMGPLKLRGEVRDFNSQEPPINLNVNNRYSHLYAGAGVVFSF